jgi:hypothetical protein
VKDATLFDRGPDESNQTIKEELIMDPYVKDVIKLQAKRLNRTAEVLREQIADYHGLKQESEKELNEVENKLKSLKKYY